MAAPAVRRNVYMRIWLIGQAAILAAQVLVARFAHAGIVEDISVPAVVIKALRVVNDDHEARMRVRPAHAASIADGKSSDQFVIADRHAGLEIVDAHLAYVQPGFHFDFESQFFQFAVCLVFTREVAAREWPPGSGVREFRQGRDRLVLIRTPTCNFERRSS
jgi:hypothetical protein